MFSLCLILSAVCAIGTTIPVPDVYQYSLSVGSGSGIEFSTASEGRITAIRVWEYPGNYITGLQLRYESNWTAVFGSEYGNQQEMQLYDKEIIIQVSGKHSGYIYELMFVTTLGRSFKVGVSAGTSFNFFPTMKGSQLRFLSGRHDGWALASIGAHWALVAVK
ncbi:zymogen granule membrane protein 16-like [Triplophysa rosa]|uniref:Zymogen granule membrane protein 16-like n=1 Tax=Triplophysa rosa TaxID=992332 RepID=A0A9W7WQ00_TRIRA|nr:zymogen granule membrane protein 16-like [Triplophysa rosa]KAI7806214.1 putative zymogen granule membrane protein 16-like [Triplophysa rosa]